jgi:hypothetical protein
LNKDLENHRKKESNRISDLEDQIEIKEKTEKNLSQPTQEL